MSEEERFRKVVNLLNEARDEVEHCAFHSRGNGMSAFACAEALLRGVSLEELARYMDVVEEVRHIPVTDHTRPPLNPQQLAAVHQAWRELPQPVLIHCSAGIDRTGAAVKHILANEH